MNYFEDMDMYKAFRHQTWMQMEWTIHRYLMSNADGRQDGAEKATRHIEMTQMMIAVMEGKMLDEVNTLHPWFHPIHDATQEMTSYMDEVIGFPIEGRPDYDDLAPKFFDHFYEISIRTIYELKNKG